MVAAEFLIKLAESLLPIASITQNPDGNFAFKVKAGSVLNEADIEGEVALTQAELEGLILTYAPAAQLGGLLLNNIDRTWAEKVKACDLGDAEAAHTKADKVLCNLLKALGYTETVEEFEKLDKWYA
jgi:hypothetical protein